LYLQDELKKMDQDCENFVYNPCVVQGPEVRYEVGDLIKIIQKLSLKTTNTTAYLCGNPDMVSKLKKNLFLAGMSMKKIYHDSFIMRKV
ncbi:hypothetical protein MJH12_03815, partial [bacterium]|nr:hypothetical protein [bacterium]